MANQQEWMAPVASCSLSDKGGLPSQQMNPKEIQPQQIGTLSETQIINGFDISVEHHQPPPLCAETYHSVLLDRNYLVGLLLGLALFVAVCMAHPSDMSFRQWSIQLLNNTSQDIPSFLRNTRDGTQHVHVIGVPFTPQQRSASEVPASSFASPPVRALQGFARWDLALCFLLLVYILSSFGLENMQFTVLHEGAISVVLGLIIGFFVVNRSAEIGFGFTLKKRMFYSFFGYVVSCGIFLTLSLFLVLAYALHALHSVHPFTFMDGRLIDLSFEACLTLAAVLACSDTVAVLSFIKPRAYPAAHAVVFGEGVVNDVVAIILSQSLLGMNKLRIQSHTDVHATQAQEGGASKIFLTLLWDVLYYLTTSSATGIAFALLISFACKLWHRVFNKDPIRAVAFIFVGSYMSYLVSDMCGFSGILSIFLCGVVTGHYAWHSLTPTGRVLASKSASLIGFIAEAFVFGYFGVTASSILATHNNFSPMLILAMSLLIPLGRTFLTPMTLWITSLSRVTGSDAPLSGTDTILIWLGGMMRGVVSYALIVHYVYEASLDRTLKTLLVSTVLGTVLVNIIVLGILLLLTSGMHSVSEEKALARDARVLLALALGASPAPLGTTPANSIKDIDSDASLLSRPLLTSFDVPDDPSIRSYATAASEREGIDTPPSTVTNLFQDIWTAEDAALVGETILRAALGDDMGERCVTDELDDVVKGLATNVDDWCVDETKELRRSKSHDAPSKLVHTPHSTVRWHPDLVEQQQLSLQVPLLQNSERPESRKALSKTSRVLGGEQRRGVARWWHQVDNNYMKPWFGGSVEPSPCERHTTLRVSLTDRYAEQKTASYQRLVTQFLGSAKRFI